MTGIKKTDSSLNQTTEKTVSKKLLGFLISLDVILFAIFLMINVFVVDTIRVRNNSLYEGTKISDAILQEDFAWNSLYLYLKYKFTDGSHIPFIDSMEVELDDPNTLIVTVYEKGILGYIRLSGSEKCVYFDTDGYVTEISKREIEGIPEIKGITIEEPELYQKLPIDTISLRDLLSLTQTIRRSGQIPDTITYGITTGPVLEYEGGIGVVLGSVTGLTQKIERMSAILPLLNEKGVLHLENWSEETTDIVFERGASVTDKKEVIYREDLINPQGQEEDEETDPTMGADNLFVPEGEFSPESVVPDAAQNPTGDGYTQETLQGAEGTGENQSYPVAQ